MGADMNSLQTTTMIATALASVFGCYIVSLHASAERAAVGAAHAQIARDMSDMRLLRTELRTRSRLPELQRWNEQVLALAPPRAEQLIANPVQLASYAAPSAPVAPAPVATVAAVVRDAPEPAPALRRASFAPRVARDLGADAALAGGVTIAPTRVAAAMQVSFQKIAVR